MFFSDDIPTPPPAPLQTPSLSRMISHNRQLSVCPINQTNVESVAVVSSPDCCNREIRPEDTPAPPTPPPAPSQTPRSGALSAPSAAPMMIGSQQFQGREDVREITGSTAFKEWKSTLNKPRAKQGEFLFIYLFFYLY